MLFITKEVYGMPRKNVLRADAVAPTGSRDGSERMEPGCP